jgi:NhaC family Na+:H+ antiporter
VDTSQALTTLASAYTITLWDLLPMAVLLLLGFRKYPAFLSILIGALAGALVAVVLQPQVVLKFADDPALSTPLALLKGVWMAMANGFISSTGVAEVDKLFTGGGMSSMLLTVWLILGAMSFGAMMDFGGSMQKLITPLINRVKSVGGTIAAVVLPDRLNIVAGDQSMIVLPARMFISNCKLACIRRCSQPR